MKTPTRSLVIPRPPLPLLLITTLILGCVVGLECANWLTTTRQAVSLSVLSQAEYANLIDHLLPYRIGAMLFLLATGLATLLVGLLKSLRHT